mgnify:CR=1 FL=1
MGEPTRDDDLDYWKRLAKSSEYRFQVSDFKLRTALGARPEEDTLVAAERVKREADEAQSRETGPTVDGRKDDLGKPMFHFIPSRSIRQVAVVLTYGARKYGEWNWKSVRDARGRYLSASFRHVWAWAGGEELDPESGLPHLAHAVASLMFIMSGELDSEMKDS